MTRVQLLWALRLAQLISNLFWNIPRQKSALWEPKMSKNPIGCNNLKSYFKAEKSQNLWKVDNQTLYQTWQLFDTIWSNIYVQWKFFRRDITSREFCPSDITSREICPSDIGPSKILSKKLYQSEVRLCKICQNIANSSIFINICCFVTY